MADERIDLKNPLLAAFLAWLIPGLGHAYQRRWFKAAIYAACIWSTWCCGWVLGDGKVVYFNRSMKRGRWTAGYAMQALVGVPALPALLQTRRASPGGEPEERSEIVPVRPLSGPFEGALVHANFTDGRSGYFKVRGNLEIEPSDDDTFRKSIHGKFTGTIHLADESEAGVPDGAPLELDINYLSSLEPEVFPSPHREMRCEVRGRVTGPKGGDVKAELRGKLLHVRGLFDRYAAPLDAEGLESAHGDLGKFFEIALVYTWIAGLLNLLAIWDAYEGPAYGYGDETPAAGAPPEPPNPNGTSTAPFSATPTTPAPTPERPAEVPRPAG